MTKQTAETPERDTKVQIDPMAAAGEYAALNEFYKNRNLLLAHEISGLRAQNDALIAELAKRDAGKQGQGK